MSRHRRSSAERRQAKAIAKWDAVENSWMKWAKCDLCKNKFCVNNNPARKVKIRRVGGMKVCAYCDSRYGKWIVQMIKICQKVADRPCPRMKNVPYSKSAMDSFFEDLEAHCKCDAHVAKRILLKNDALELGR